MASLIQTIHADLTQHAERAFIQSQHSFFKEDIETIGVRQGLVRKIAAKYFTQIEPRTKKGVFALCEKLLETNIHEHSVIAFAWASNMRKEFTPQDFRIFEHWLKTYVNNWAKCDDFCTGALGELLVMYPELLKKTIPWRTSKNRWVRRGSAVSLIVPIRKMNVLPEVFEAADALMADEDDLVRKGYGWLLKVASASYPKEVFQYVLEHKEKMPRVALRYAIEKMPPKWKKQAMAQK